MAAGQLAASPGTVVEPARSTQHPLSVMLYNTDTGNETVTLQVTPSGGTIQTVFQVTLAAGEHAVASNIVLGPGDTLTGIATNGSKVNYLTVPLGTNFPLGPPTLTVLDANGAQKTNGTATTGAVVNPAVNFKNVIDGGDFTVNPFQRGTSQAADIAATLTYGPDRFFFKGGASSTINWSQVADTNVAGFANSLKWQRKSGNANTAAFNMGQVMETADCVRLQGQQVTLSFWARSGANYSGGALTVNLFSGTGSNESAANMLAGSWTGSTTPVSSTQAITATMTRFSFTGTLPAGCTQIGVQFQWTPAGTAGADDSVVMNGIQLELGGQATAFEHRDLEVELALCQRYYFQVNEANGSVIAVGAPSGTNTQSYSLWLPTPMRVAPTVAVVAGGFKVIVDGAAAAAVSGFAGGSAHSPSIITLVTTQTLTAAAHSILLQGSATTGNVNASADF